MGCASPHSAGCCLSPCCRAAAWGTELGSPTSSGEPHIPALCSDINRIRRQWSGAAQQGHFAACVSIAVSPSTGFTACQFLSLCPLRTLFNSSCALCYSGLCHLLPHSAACMHLHWAFQLCSRFSCQASPHLLSSCNLQPSWQSHWLLSCILPTAISRKAGCSDDRSLHPQRVPLTFAGLDVVAETHIRGAHTAGARGLWVLAGNLQYL